MRPIEGEGSNWEGLTTVAGYGKVGGSDGVGEGSYPTRPLDPLGAGRMLLAAPRLRKHGGVRAASSLNEEASTPGNRPRVVETAKRSRMS